MKVAKKATYLEPGKHIIKKQIKLRPHPLLIVLLYLFRRTFAVYTVTSGCQCLSAWPGQALRAFPPAVLGLKRPRRLVRGYLKASSQQDLGWTVAVHICQKRE